MEKHNPIQGKSAIAMYQFLLRSYLHQASASAIALQHFSIFQVAWCELCHRDTLNQLVADADAQCWYLARELGGSGRSCYHCNVWRTKRKRNNQSLSPSASTANVPSHGTTLLGK